MKRITEEVFVQDDVTGRWTVKTKTRWEYTDEEILDDVLRRSNRDKYRQAINGRYLPTSTLAEIMAAYDEYKKNCC